MNVASTLLTAFRFAAVKGTCFGCSYKLSSFTYGPFALPADPEVEK